MLAGEGICLERAGRSLLRGVNAGVCPGEFLAIVGPNGAGKSTLLEVLSGVRRPQAGSVTLDGIPLAAWPPAALARRRAVLPQSVLAGFPMPVMELVAMGRSPYAGLCSRQRDREVIAASLGATQALDLAGRDDLTLSGGERQRAHLARVLAQLDFDGGPPGEAARYLLLDEPLNNLDPAHQQLVMGRAAALAQAGYGVIAVLHDANMASLHAHRIMVLHEGRMVATGCPERVFTDTLMAEVFGLEAIVLRHPLRHCPVLVPA